MSSAPAAAASAAAGKSTTKPADKKQKKQRKPKADDADDANKETWQGPLNSVPISMINFCLEKCALQEQHQDTPIPDKEKLSRDVTVHLSKGNTRYRATKLLSMDKAMNLSLGNVVVSKAPREKQKKIRKGVDNQKQQKRVQALAAATAGFEQPAPRVPIEERLQSASKSCFVPGSSVVMMQLPQSWAPLFEHQAAMALSEYWRVKRNKAHEIKEKKKRKKAKADARKRDKKEMRTEKEGLLKKGASAARQLKKKGGL